MRTPTGLRLGVGAVVVLAAAGCGAAGDTASAQLQKVAGGGDRSAAAQAADLRLHTQPVDLAAADGTVHLLATDLQGAETTDTVTTIAPDGAVTTRTLDGSLGALAIAASADGTVYVGATSGVYALDGSKPEHLVGAGRSAEASSDGDVYDVTVVDRGRVAWLERGPADGATRVAMLDGDEVVTVATSEDAGELAGAQAIAAGGAETLYVATDDNVVQVSMDGQVRSVPAPDGLAVEDIAASGEHLVVLDKAHDADGAAWSWSDVDGAPDLTEAIASADGPAAVALHDGEAAALLGSVSDIAVDGDALVATGKTPEASQDGLFDVLVASGPIPQS